MRSIAMAAILSLVLPAVLPLPAVAGPVRDSGRLLLLSAYAQAREKSDRAATEIVRLDAEIARNEASIGSARKIITLARQRTDADARKAEAIAGRALEKAAAAKRVNELARTKWRLAKVRSDAAGSAVHGRLARGADSAASVSGLLTERTGKVWAFKADGRETPADGGFLEKGDRLRVEEGRAELKIFDGRGVAVIGPGTEIVLAEDSSAGQVLDQIGGKLHVAVEKTDDYARRMSSWFAEFAEDMRTIAGADMAELEKTLSASKRWMEMRYRARNKVTAVLGVRGTRFSSEAISGGGLAVTVLEGAVEISIPGPDRTISITAGEKAIVGPDGTILRERPEQIDAWWEDPET